MMYAGKQACKCRFKSDHEAFDARLKGLNFILPVVEASEAVEQRKGGSEEPLGSESGSVGQTMADRGTRLGGAGGGEPGRPVWFERTGSVMAPG